MSPRKQVTLQHIADRLHTSVHTVSKALRGLPGMSEETRRSVFRAARELGYRTKAQEHAMAIDRLSVYPDKPHRFVFVTTHNGYLVKQLYSGLYDRLSELGHLIDFAIYPEHETHPERIRDWFQQYGVSYASGVFIPPTIPLPLEQELLALPIPRVLLNFPQAGTESDSVIWDVYDAVSQSVMHLVREGHRRIMYVGDIRTQRGFRRRWQAFTESSSEAGIQTPPEESLLVPQGTQAEWDEAFRAKWDSLRPTAILCVLDTLIPWIYYACRGLGLRIPEDVSLVGLETNEEAFLPDLTRPLLPVRETGVRAADRMLWRLANPHLPYEHIRLQCRWHKGATVRKM
ncbi:LacI family DNA-binding transcriptional regulator [Paenibacillus flagellatus]|uniref:HTH lacI-type domain-containing protein n=1 Tax=Paenibacillus flagellatus TaxID=2211139 RepID=A0A2V5KA63_9BACL|nr:LacI family DNA-binding transcriptional regulator [Paenibacillus flagellatus]PYI56318.1 hypothetical protein DLM86_04885 [Paenibacillus flagellatus]